MASGEHRGAQETFPENLPWANLPWVPRPRVLPCLPSSSSLTLGWTQCPLEPPGSRDGCRQRWCPEAVRGKVSPRPAQPVSPWCSSGQNPAPAIRSEWPGGSGGSALQRGVPGEDSSGWGLGPALLPRQQGEPTFALRLRAGGERSTGLCLPAAVAAGQCLSPQKAVAAQEGGSLVPGSHHIRLGTRVHPAGHGLGSHCWSSCGETVVSHPWPHYGVAPAVAGW